MQRHCTVSTLIRRTICLAAFSNSTQSFRIAQSNWKKKSKIKSTIETFLWIRDYVVGILLGQIFKFYFFRESSILQAEYQPAVTATHVGALVRLIGGARIRLKSLLVRLIGNGLVPLTVWLAPFYSRRRVKRATARQRHCQTPPESNSLVSVVSPDTVFFAARKTA